MENHTAKHFVLQLGSLASLYLSLSFFIVLVFGFINIRFPDVLDSVWQIEQAASSIRIGFAMVVVFFPTYLILTRTVNKHRRNNKNSAYLGLTKWLIYLSLLVGGAVLLGDLVAVIMGFLEGELTTRFILKALAVFIVTGLAFYYYLLDAKGYWLKNEKQSLGYGLLATTIILVILGASVANIQTPTEVREVKLDTQMVGDLQDMQWRIEEYYRVNESLPEDLTTLYGSFDVPTPPGDKPAYVYSTTDDTSYQLCATFTHNSDFTSNSIATPERISLAPGYPGNYNWDYKAGEWCFDRVIDETYKQ